MARRTFRLAEDIAERFNQARLDSGLTIRQLAEIAQVDKTTVSAIAAAKSRNPGVATLVDLANALGVKPSWLVFGE
jgi:transcriptional regulator with XRE-family HTH domain